MRIAVSGAHRTGKSTLVEELRRALPGHDAVEEPYRALENEGHAFRDPPTLEDFESQLDRSIQSILEGSPDRIFDRCPADFLAYATTHRDRGAFDLDAWLPRVQTAMGRLDLIVFVPIEQPDRVDLGPGDRPRWRRAVDDELRSILFDDPWEFGAPTVEVRGNPEQRLGPVLERLRTAS